MPRAEKKNDDFSLWVSELTLRKHACCAVVAVAHKIARLRINLFDKQEASISVLYLFSIYLK